MLDYLFSSQFKKDLKLMEKRHYDTNAVFDIIGKIIYEQPLPKHCREHELHGVYEGFTECHVKDNLLLVYRFKPGEV
ncbi:MAG: type II toxin-antitoxin system YafQ family toxin, partial [Treponema sp.]|nr:type II toxin-antitoxin system YafQ family toxin [Treponema sp.]